MRVCVWLRGKESKANVGNTAETERQGGRRRGRPVCITWMLICCGESAERMMKVADVVKSLPFEEAVSPYSNSWKERRYFTEQHRAHIRAERDRRKGAKE